MPTLAAAAQDPSTVPPGELRVIRERDAAGRLITSWIGSDYVGPWLDNVHAARRGLGP